MDGLKAFFQQLAPRRLMIMGAVAVALLTVLGLVAFRGSSPEMGYLYTDLTPANAKSITDKLAAQGIPYEISTDGTSVMAPRDRLAELRMSLASEQMGAKIGYEVLDQEQPFGVSAERARINETRALEGELSKSIETLKNVSAARVHIVMPERAIFATQSRKATAAVTLSTQGRLPNEAVDSIRYLVSSAVPELSPDNVSIADQTGALLARAGEGAAAVSRIEEQQNAMAEQLRSQVEALLEPIVGQGKVRAEVAVLLNRAQAREESETFDPDNQVVARQVTVEAKDQSAETDPAARAASVGAQLPDSQALGGPGGNSRNAARNETSEDTTYQNSVTRKVTETAPGGIERLTVAVMLDGGAKGMPEAQVQRLSRLVENAVGFDAQRGDSVVVESIAFSTPKPIEDVSAGLPLGLTADQIISVLKLLMIAVVGLIAIRMLRSKKGAEEPLLAAAAGVPGLPAPEASVPLLGSSVPQPDDSAASRLSYLGVADDGSELRHEIEVAQASSAEKHTALEQVGQAVSQNPAEAAALVRQWLNS